MADRIQVERLIEQTFVRDAKWLNEVDSTNNWAIQTLNEMQTYPTVVGADRQTAGRGRGANQWWAGEGSLTFSLVIDPLSFAIAKGDWPLLSLSIGLAISTGLSSLLPEHDFQLKWPNDVFADRKKICGILIETSATRPELLIIGIGINVNNSLEAAPADVKARATSCVDLSGQAIDRTDALIAVLNGIAAELAQLAESSSTMILRWRERCLLTGHAVQILPMDDQPISGANSSGTCVGIDDDGSLRVMTETGLKKFYAGRVLFSFDD